MTHSRWTHWLANIVVVFLVVVSAMFTYWGVIDTDIPIQFVDRHVEGYGPDEIVPVMVGSQIVVQGQVCSSRSVPQIDIHRRFVDGLVFELPTIKAVENRMIPSGCYRYERKIPIPHTLPPGYYRQETTVTVQLNPLRTSSFTTNSIRLRVSRPPGWTEIPPNPPSGI